MYNSREHYRRRNPTSYDNVTSFLHAAEEINADDNIGLETGATGAGRYISYRDVGGGATSQKFTKDIVNRFASSKNKKQKKNKTSSYAHDDDNFVDSGEDYNEGSLSIRFGLMLGLGLLAAVCLSTFLGTDTPEMPNIPRSLMKAFSYTAVSLLPSRVPFLGGTAANVETEEDEPRPDFVYEHPYVSSSYYTSTKSIKTLLATQDIQVKKNLRRLAEEEAGKTSREMKTRLAIVRPFCEFDAEALPTTFACWNGLTPCKAAQDAIGDDYDEDDEFEVGPNGEFIAYRNSTGGRNLYEELGDRHLFDFVGSDAMKSAKADVFLFYSQTFGENEVAIKAVDTIIDQFFEPGGWSQCFDNIYAIEANIPQELDLYIPSAQEELYNWVNGPNRQYEAAFRIIQSGEWGDYDGFYLMEGDSVPIKSHWLDVVLSEIEANRPFAILGAQYDGDKWDNFYEQIPISLLHHTNGNAIYNTSHPLLERLAGQLEVEAPCPYNSIPYDYRMSQMWVEGTLGIVPDLAPKIMLNEEGENITLSDNRAMFKKWADIWEKEDPFKYTPVIHNYAATNLIPRHLGPEYIIHGAKLYSPWDPTRTEVTLVVSEWFFDRSIQLIKNLDEKDHPFSEVVVMIPPAAITHDDYDMMTEVPVRAQHRAAPDFMDLCEADIKTEWFMITNSYHQVSRHVDLMFTPGKFQPVIPFTPATYPFCFKFPYCKETINLAQRFKPGHDKVVLDMDMLYHTASRNAFCKEWKEENGEEGEDLYKHHQRRLMFRKKIIGPPGPTGTSYFAWLSREGKDGMYKMTDRSLYGARPPFVKVFAKEEKLDGMSEDELAKRVGMTLLDNSTDCNCAAFETQADCEGSGMGCAWRDLFESCHPPELIDGGEPICQKTEAPTMSPTVSLEGVFDATESPTTEAESTTAEETAITDEENPWFVSMFKSREHESATNNSTEEDATLMADDDDVILEPGSRALGLESLDSFYESNLNADERFGISKERLQVTAELPTKKCDSWMPTVVCLSTFLGTYTPEMPNIPRSLMKAFSYTAVSLLPSRVPFLGGTAANVETEEDEPRPDFVYEHPYVSSSYYTSTKSIKTLLATQDIQVKKNLRRLAEEEAGKTSREMKTRLAIVRPFCEFDAEALPTTFACWNGLTPCKAAQDAIGDDYDEDDEFEVGPNGEFIAYRNSTGGRNLYEELGDRHLFDFVGSDAMKSAKADVFLFYSQTFGENEVAIKAVDTIIDQFFEPGGWSQCFDNIYAIEANIPQELDLYIPSAQEELYNWVNGPNRQYEAAFRIIQSGEWGDYDGFYLMEGDSVPIKSHWLDVVLSEIEANRPFAILGAQYNGDKWDNFYEQIPISLLHHTNGNAIYNTSHPLLERLAGQLEVEAPCPYNSIPYDYRMSQMWVEGTLGIVPDLAPKIMLNEEGENITLSDNRAMFKKWADIWEKEDPFKYTPVIHNYAATNLIPRHLGPEYIIHGAKLYSPWDPTRTEVTLVVSEWFFDRSIQLIKNLDEKDHPFSEVVVMIPPAAITHDDYDMMTEVPVRAQHRAAPDFMDLCEADIKTEWFMITNSYHQVSRHVDLMFTPGKFQPVIPFTPATYPFCFKFPYCKETINLAQRFKPGHDKVVLDMDMLYHTASRNAFCKEWKEENGEEGEDLYKHHQRRLMFRKKIIGPPGPTGTSYFAWLSREGKDGMYKMTDRSLYGARPPFVKVFAKEEKLDGMSEDELAKRVGMTLLDNSTDCNCAAFETQADCEGSGMGCAWRDLFESCHPPELIDGGEPICQKTEAPTMSPTVSLEGVFDATESPTTEAESTTAEETAITDEENPWFVSMFKSREHESATNNSTEEDATLMADDDDVILEPGSRALGLESLDSFYESNLNADERFGISKERLQVTAELPTKKCDSWMPTVVPRKKTVSSMWDGASSDPDSRAFSASDVSRPRKLHSSSIQYEALLSGAKNSNSPDAKAALEGIVDTSSSLLQNSWLTSTVPINVPKYSIQHSHRLSETSVVLPAKIQKTLVDYGDGTSYEPLRISFESDHLVDFSNQKRSKKSVTASAILAAEALTGDILPAVTDIWANALSIVRSSSAIFPLSNSGVSDEKICGEAVIPQQHLKNGVQKSDIVIYVTPNGHRCYTGDGDTPSDILSYSTICSFDQNMRPIAANIVVCFDSIDVSSGEVSVEESLRLTASLTVEVGKVLGMSSSLYPYYRNTETGQPFGATRKEVTCVDGSTQTLSMPNVLQATVDVNDDRLIQSPAYEIVTPTVRQVVRNHFDCQSLSGARLARGGKSCFGDYLEPRIHFDEDFVPMGGSPDMAYSLSPLTLALLEDSGWYRANFALSTTPLFGRGAGCGFVEGNCVSYSKDVPEYSHGFFCGDSSEGDWRFGHQPLGCDYTHNHKADCTVPVGIDPNCPMRRENLVSCVDKSNSPSLAGELYSDNSRCFETNVNAVCLESYCNSVDSKIDIVIDGKVHQCDYEGQLVDIDMGYFVRCPRLAVVCPHFVCPANCSGKGVCDYCKEVPECICDNPFDESKGCFGSESE